jgi:hypothetical protein
MFKNFHNMGFNNVNKKWYSKSTLLWWFFTKFQVQLRGCKMKREFTSLLDKNHEKKKPLIFYNDTMNTINWLILIKNKKDTYVTQNDMIYQLLDLLWKENFKETCIRNGRVQMKSGLRFRDVGVNFLLQREKLHYVIFFPTMYVAIKKKLWEWWGEIVCLLFSMGVIWCMCVYYFERTMNCER